MTYMILHIAHGAQIELLFALRPTVCEIFTYKYSLPYDQWLLRFSQPNIRRVIIGEFSFECLEFPKLMYKQLLKTPEVQIELLFALRPTVFEIFTTEHQASDNR